MKIRPCAVPGCDRPHAAHGLCKLHYMRRQRGTPQDKPLEGKAFTTKRGEPRRYVHEAVLDFDGDECLIWPYARDRAGYARITIDNRVQKIASRYICELIYGPPPSVDAEAVFTCRNGKTGCVNPKHLVWLTRAERLASIGQPRKFPPLGAKRAPE